MKYTKAILAGTTITLIIIQTFRIDKSAPVSEGGKDLLSIAKPPVEIATILKKSCFDCHSNETAYPWYTNVAPVSWWIKHHIDEGRAELNFSEWANYSSRKMDHKLEECIEMLEENEMPLSSYTLLHGEAELTAEQKEQLISWCNSLRTHESDTPEK